MSKVIIVDDQEDIRRMIALTLTAEYEIFEAGDAATAEQIIRQEKPDVAVLDVMMPGDMNGFDLCRIIKQEEELQHMWVILVTARSQDDDIAKGASAGADSYYVKPFSPLALIHEIRNHTGHALT